MLDNFLTHKEEIWANDDVVLEKNAENSMNGASSQQGSFKKASNE